MTAVEVRRAAGGDVPGIAEVHVRSWRAAYRGILPDELLDGLSVPERAASWRTILESGKEHWLILVAENDGELAGFCAVAMPGRDLDTDEETAEMGALYVDPGHWRKGVGASLVTAAREELKGAAFRDLVLWVLPENHAALAFYQRFGFKLEEGVEKREERSGRPVVRLRVALAPGQRPESERY